MYIIPDFHSGQKAFLVVVYQYFSYYGVVLVKVSEEIIYLKCLQCKSSSSLYTEFQCAKIAKNEETAYRFG